MTRLTQSLLTAATFAALASTGLAQTRVDRSGANDANNKIGSNGRNDVGGGRQMPWDIQNNIVYGNVSGGKQFRGNVTTFDNQAFQGRTGSTTFDNFVRDSSSVTTGGVATYNANQTHAYYGDSRGVAPPAGYVGVNTSGGYSPPVPTAWNSVDPRGSTVGTVTVVSRPDQFMQPGPVDSLYAPGALAISPTAQLGGGVNGANLSDYTTLNTTTVNQLTPAQIKQIQSDSSVSQIPGQTPQTGGTNPVEAGSQPQQTGGTPQPNPGQVRPSNSTATPSTPQMGLVTTGQGQTAPAASTPDASALDNSTGDTSVNNAAPSAALGATGAPEAGLVTRMVPKVGQPQTPQTSANTSVGLPNTPAARPGQSAEDAARNFNTALRKQQAATGDKTDAAALPTTPTPAAPGGHAASAGNAKGLGDLLGKANDLVKSGKYATAIDTYSAAEALAPGNAQIRLGRANAELGGAYYRRAVMSLRAAAKADPKVVAIQTDLRNSLGDDRLTAAQKDLGDLVQKAGPDTGPAVLLAYVYYNTGNERRATALLDLADQRAGGKDPLVTQLKAAWGGTSGETK